MSELLKILKSKNSRLADKVEFCKEEISSILNTTIVRFPSYTDHSLKHSMKVMQYCGYLISDVDEMTHDELFVLLSACLLHDVGMAIPDKTLEKYCKECHIVYNDNLDDSQKQKIVRDHHHIFSEMYIIAEWKHLGIPTKTYAKAIALVAKGHREIDLLNDNSYKAMAVKDGEEIVRLKYLSVILRMADELDISTERTPELYCKYYYPDNLDSQKEFEKHLNIPVISFSPEGVSKVHIEFECTNLELYTQFRDMVDRIKAKLSYCQEVLIINKFPQLKINLIDPDYKRIEFERELQKKPDKILVNDDKGTSINTSETADDEQNMRLKSDKIKQSKPKQTKREKPILNQSVSGNGNIVSTSGNIALKNVTFNINKQRISALHIIACIVFIGIIVVTVVSTFEYPRTDEEINAVNMSMTGLIEAVGLLDAQITFENNILQDVTDELLQGDKAAYSNWQKSNARRIGLVESLDNDTSALNILTIATLTEQNSPIPLDVLNHLYQLPLEHKPQLDSMVKALNNYLSPDSINKYNDKMQVVELYIEWLDNYSTATVLNIQQVLAPLSDEMKGRTLDALAHTGTIKDKLVNLSWSDTNHKSKLEACRVKENEIISELNELNFKTQNGG